MTKVLLSLGSNIDPVANLTAAVQRIAERFEVLGVSSVYETEPVRRPEQPCYLNAAVAIVSALEPDALKRELLEIEAAMGRTRVADKDAPRVIDIDITLYGQETVQMSQRGIPDPDLLEGAHIARPAAELWPAYRHPEDGRTLAEIAEAVPDVGICLRTDIILWSHSQK
ncbi:MAG: 2-amino-4-hydroxy-6-hydroxymethyldihydropteridine diphosphokinase [Anaerolineae bacterium]|nr:2-amino-4-hydroxy-6-hydroxymethyldihydropteridine diphosphokinase [Anaerolineae bacterium]